ncbi:MAG TPA: DNA polymerase IV [Candidatus Cloacimonadota bacterium]|jgi:DNA polymerase-4|nr:DNA polymerase IV [Candidatus Cloacimonadota bacterium]HOF59576.1 DNA polymerase IV [Candidatus Cloacimonadota bacterium]HOR58711.1 DNA polymerase IV [Candidatus Cloacimonadota bacterium]HPB08136.1 DNA polymerase IV [Candidatus Cloacimonadota bacterium]HQL13335.1 DNA polymerase IV [Candidatus Cloacimonadota bacterium]
MKKIIHIDMDAYFAALEIRENPALEGKCVIVGGSPNSRGVVSTCSYEARKYGVRSGMSSQQAWKLCPRGIFIRPNFQLYRKVSEQIRNVFFSYTELVETMSLDEAYLDVNDKAGNLEEATEIARSIKKEILAATRLTCSAGVSFNKFLAKIGSELNKPDGLSVIRPQNAQEILFSLPIGKFYGIGRVTAARMQKMGINNGKDLYNKELRILLRHFGKLGQYYYDVVRGIDNREVVTETDPKSISCESTFPTDIGDIDELIAELKELVERLVNRMTLHKIQGRNITLKIKYEDFELNTRSCPLPETTNDISVLFEYAQKLLVANWNAQRKIRLLGVGVGKLDLGEKNGDSQLEIPI